jgi:hypothetical protein
MAEAPATLRPPETKTFFLYVDEGGAQVVVDSLKKVPSRYRSAVRAVTLPVDNRSGEASWSLDSLRKVAERISMPAAAPASFKEVVSAIHWPSVGLGAVAAAVLWSAWTRLGKSRGVVLKTAVIILALALSSGVYLGWLRRSAGLAKQAVSTPQTIVDDARKAATQIDNFYKTQQSVIDQVDGTSSAAPASKPSP